MPEQEIDPFSQIPELDALSEIDRRISDINAKLGDGTLVSFVQASFEKAKARLEEQASQVAEFPGLQDRMAQIGSEALRGVEQLEMVRDILDPNEVDAQQERLQGWMRRVSDFFEQHEAMTSQAQETKKALAVGISAVHQEVRITEAGVPSLEDPGTGLAAHQEASPDSSSVNTRAGGGKVSDPERNTSSDILTFEKIPEGVRINGTFIPNHKIGTTRREAKIRFLEVVAKLKPGDRKVPRDIYREVYPRMQYNRHAFHADYNWLNAVVEKVTGQPVLVENGQTGLARRYLLNTAFQSVEFVDRATEGAGTDNVAERADDEGSSSRTREVTGDKSKRLTIIVSNEWVKVGKRSSRELGYNLRNREGDRDYTMPRLSAMKALAEKGEITAGELYKLALYGPNYDGERNVVAEAALRKWLTQKITHGRHKVFEHNGGRTQASGYRIAERYEGIDFVVGDDVPEDSPIRDLFQGSGARDSKGERLENNDLTSRDAFLVARQLHRYNFILRKCGLPEVTDECLAALEDSVRAPLLIEDAKVAERALVKSAAKLCELFEDEEKLSKLLAGSTPDDPLYGFVEYLADMAGNDGLELVELLMRAKVISDVWIARAGQLDVVIPTAVVTADGRIISPTEYNQIGLAIDTLRVENDKQYGGEAQNLQGQGSSDGGKDLIGKSKEKPETERIKELREFATAIAEEFVAGLDPADKYPVVIINQYVPRFNVVAVRKVLQSSANILTQEIDAPSHPFGLEEVIRVLAFNSKGHKNTMLHRSGQKAVKKAIESAVLKGINDYKKQQVAKQL